jgi:hypothetical protein
MTQMKSTELGYFGNIWVRQNTMELSGVSHSGHKHHFDHVTLLTKGKVKIDVEGQPSKEFTAPTFIVIRKELEHKITALSDDVLYYCVFALRNLDGDVSEIYGEEHNPLSALPKEN